MKLKRYVRYLKNNKQHITDDVDIKGWLERGNWKIIATADFLLELAQKGDEIVYKINHSKYETKKDIVLAVKNGYIETRYATPNISDVIELWVRQDDDTFKRYEL